MLKPRPVRLAIGAIFKNEGRYILEWVAYHRVIGVDHFFIADNNSSDGSSEILANLHAAGIITHIPFPGVPNKPPQLTAYAEIMRRYRRRADWMAFIDADEYLLPTDGERSIRPLIEEMHRRPEIGAIGVNWATYGSSGLQEATDDLVIERFSGRGKDEWGTNLHVKSIVRTAAWAGVLGTPHVFALRSHYKIVHPTGEDLFDHPQRGSGLSRKRVWNRLRINHYVIKSKREFEEKRQRGRATSSKMRDGRFYRAHDRNEVSDPVPGWLVEATKREIAALRAALDAAPRDGARPPTPSPRWAVAAGRLHASLGRVRRFLHRKAQSLSKG